MAAISLLFAGVGAFLQWMATRDQLSQSIEAREERKKEEAALFDVRSKAGKLYLMNYSRHTVRSVEVYMHHLETKKRILFPVSNVGPCKAVVYSFRYSPKGKPAPAHLSMHQVAYRDWEGRDWATGGGLPLTNIDNEYRNKMRGKSVIFTDWQKLLDWPRKESEISDCAGR
ncbi:hypothetical protein [Streptomyces violaceusniger]|uniref:hypothetical protein n=1 Tax=Streptomyces violaceusniger TaxID=68280 RepID=UPI0012373DED|nr:hypothetical protein [Streptomyces violaceusniger]